MPGPLDALKNAFPPNKLSQQILTSQGGPGSTDPEALIKQRQAVNSMASGQPVNPQAPFQGQPNPLGNVSHGGFSFHQTTPDIEGLVAALKGGGMTGSRPGRDIDLDQPQPEAQMPFEELMRRAQAIR